MAETDAALQEVGHILIIFIMKNFFGSISMLLCLAFLGCNSDELRDIKLGDVKPITNRICPGDYVIFNMEKGKCKNDCERGISLRCGGSRIMNRCGRLSVKFYFCGEAYSESADFEPMPTMAAADTMEGVRARVEFPDRYHARFVFLEDITDELALDSDFTITNNIRWEDELGYTFNGNTYHNFQFIGGDYPIVVTTGYPYGTALVDISSY